MVIFLTQQEEFDFFSPPCVRKVPKQIKTDGDARLCVVCHANTVYSNTPCAVCGIKTDNQFLRYSGKYIPKLYFEKYNGSIHNDKDILTDEDFIATNKL